MSPVIPPTENVPAADIAAAYEWSLAFAKGQARRYPGDLADLCHDAATDAIVWSIRNYRPTGKFEAFAASAVRRFVARAIAKSARKHRDRPAMGSLSDELTDSLPGRGMPSAGEVPLPSTVRDLPADLASAVRLFHLDGYSLRDCGLLLGISPETVRARLRRAAIALNPGVNPYPPRRPNGSKRLSAG